MKIKIKYNAPVTLTFALVSALILTLDSTLNTNIIPRLCSIPGKGGFDLRNVYPADSQKIFIRLNTVFGSSDILYNDTIPLSIKSTSAFGGTKLPSGNTEAFGTYEFNTDTAGREPLVRIETNTVFGGTLFKRM